MPNCSLIRDCSYSRITFDKDKMNKIPACTFEAKDKYGYYASSGSQTPNPTGGLGDFLLVPRTVRVRLYAQMIVDNLPTGMEEP